MTTYSPARADGLTDDTGSIQKAINGAVTENGTVALPPSSAPYRMGAVPITGPCTIDLCGQKIELIGYQAGFRPQGSIPNLTIKNGSIVGSGVLADAQTAIVTSGVIDLTSVYDLLALEDLDISNVMNGAILDGVQRGRARNVNVKDTVGTASGQGNGIAFGSSWAPLGGMSVDSCSFINCTRQGLYVAGNRNVGFRNLLFSGCSSGAALAISRSQNTNGGGLTFDNCGKCIQVDDQTGGLGVCKVTNLNGINIFNPTDVAVQVGITSGWTPGSVEVRDVMMSDVLIRYDGTPPTYPTAFSQSVGLTLRNWRIAAGGPVGGLLRFNSSQWDYFDDAVIDGVDCNVPSGEYIATLPSAIYAGTQRIAFRNINAANVTTPFPFSGSIANPNLRLAP